jgi:hypothetical protein
MKLPNPSLAATLAYKNSGIGCVIATIYIME